MITAKVRIIDGKQYVDKLFNELRIGSISGLRLWPNNDIMIFYTNGVVEMVTGHDTNVVDLTVYTNNFKNLGIFIDRIIDIVSGIIGKDKFKTEDYIDISIHSNLN